MDDKEQVSIILGNIIVFANLAKEYWDDPRLAGKGEQLAHYERFINKEFKAIKRLRN